MKILLISDSQSIHTRRWVESLEKEGCEVHLVSFRPPLVSYRHFYLLKNFGLGKLGYFLAIPQLRHLANIIHPDIVHAHHVTSYGFLASCARLSPLVVTAWGSDVLLSPNDSWVLRQFVKFALNRADHITVVAAHMKAAIEKLGIAETNILVIPFGVNLEKFSWREPLAISKGPLRIICTRGFSSVYDIPTFIRGVSKLLRAGIDLRVELVGDGPLKEEIIKLIQNLKMLDHVVFRGRLEPAEMATALSDAEVFMSPSLSDGNNISLNEAMACGTIPVVSRIPANETWLIEGESGFFFEPGSPFELAAAIERAISARPRWKSIAIKNRETVMTRANWDQCIRLTLGLYRDILRRRH